MEAILQLHDIAKTYRHGRNLIEALQGISLSLPPGQVVGLVGPNGAGKTTLLKVVTGLTQVDRGKIRLFGEERNERHNQHIGFLPENPQFFKNITARELVLFSLKMCRAQAPASRVEEVLAQVDLLAAADRPIRTYSKGMRQRAGLAQALVHEPQFLILDEPMSGLDPSGRKRMKEIMRAYLNPQRTILFSSHDLGDVEDLCSRILWVEEGKLRLDESLFELQKQSAYEVVWRKGKGQRVSPIANETALWSLLDELRVGGGHILRVQRSLGERITQLLNPGERP